jgi:hypothetical protein
MPTLGPNQRSAPGAAQRLLLDAEILVGGAESVVLTRAYPITDIVAVPVSIGFRPWSYNVLLSSVQPIRDVFLSHAQCSSAEAQQPAPIVIDAGCNQHHMP